MTQQEKEKMFLDLNGVLVKFWKEQGRPDKEIKIELLERMLNWQKKTGIVIPDEQSKEPIKEDLEEAAVNGADELLAMPKDYVLAAKADYWNGAYDVFIVGAEWQKEQNTIRTRYKTRLDCYEQGRQDMREEMMKNAVEVTVVESYGCEKGEDGEWRGVVTPTISFETADFSIGERVKILIIPEKEEQK